MRGFAQMGERLKKKLRIKIIIGLLFVLLLTGCTNSVQTGNNGQDSGQNGNDTGFILAGPGSFDSADTAVVVKVNTDEKTITFLNLTVSKNYTLNYDGTTVFSD